MLTLSRDYESGQPRITPLLPDEILSQIARACVERSFRVQFQVTKTAVSQKLTHPLRGKRSVHVRRLCFDGVPNPMEIKLVNSLFYHEVWTGICRNFDGCMELNLYGSLGDTIIEYTNKILHSADRLSWLLPKIQHIKLCSDQLCRPLRSMQIYKFPNLRTVHLGKVSQVWENGGHMGEKDSILAGSMDGDLIKAFRQDAHVNLDFAGIDNVETGRITFFLEYTVSVERADHTIAGFAFDLNVTDLHNVTVMSRRWVPHNSSRYLRFIP